MKKFFVLSCIFALSFNTFAQNNQLKFSGWKQAETQHFRFIFEEAQREAAEGFMLYADDAWNKVAKIYGLPQEKTNVYVTGRTNTVNAYTFSAPTEIMMFTNPCAINDFTFRDNWQQLFFTHELVHVANFRFEDRSQLLTKLFGDFIINFDFMNVNDWALEGLATVMETELLNGGRGRSPYFEMEYKAPTLDNGFISYDEIGMESEPPYGQAYVMGYLIMKSIADRFGLDALADIERNRSFAGSWEESVKLVTGQTVQDIYRDVRIALAKKYADERKIPEGIIISPRIVNTNYYKPAIVLDDGTLIALRSADGQNTAVVRLDPGAKTGSSWIEDTKPEEDLNTIFNETILFTGSFMDKDSITADENGTVYAIMGNQRKDRTPGIELEAALYSWTKEDGKKQLTNNVSLFQPSVSRNGNVLVAVQQNGMKLRLVKIDTETGDVTPLLEDKNLSFVYPAVNADGTKIAFLVLDDTRAKVAVADLSSPENYEIVANDEEKIYDPSYPAWNQDGTLSYCCNYRGRLEIFEAVKADDEWTYNPVLSDPIGATWSYKNERGVYYSSQSSSGNVIKIKPLSEWGNPADFEGPSEAGEKICFGDLENDFPDFKPYTILSEIEIPEDETETEKSAVEKPIPVKGKTVKHRSEENKKAAEQANTASTTLENEKNFIPLPHPILYSPLISFFDNSIKDEFNFGYGGFILAETPKLQMTPGYLLADLFYFPKLTNFDADFDFYLPLSRMELDLISSHHIYVADYNNSKAYDDLTYFQLGATIPFINQYKQNYNAYLNMYAAADFRLDRYSTASTKINADDFTNKIRLMGFVGSEASTRVFGKKDSYKVYSANITGIGDYDFDTKHFYIGAEGQISAKRSSCGIGFETGVILKARYAPFPEDTVIKNTCVTYGGSQYDCTYPGMIVPQLFVTMPSLLISGIQYKAYSELLSQFGNKEKTGSLIDKSAMVGLEAGLYQDLLEANLGISYKYNFGDSDSDSSPFNFYIGIKYHWLKQ